MERALQALFIDVVNMSITASYAIAAVLAARLLLRKAPRIFLYGLWSVVFFRLVCPFSFSSFFSFLPWGGTGPGALQYIPPDIDLMAEPRVRTGIAGLDSAVNAVLPSAEPYASINPMQIILPLLTFIWVSGIAVLLVYSVVSFLRLKLKLRTAIHMEGRIYESGSIDSPFVLGILRPRIYLPPGLTGVERGFILKHEEVHIKRMDYLIKPAAFIALSIHWFNPLVWLGYSLMTKDMEMSCDERVLKELGTGIKKGYSTSLLSLATGKGTGAASPLAFGESAVKQRIKNVLGYKTPALGLVVLTGIVAVVIGAGLLANPRGSGPVYFSEDYRISVAYPSDWHPEASGDKNAYAGADGYFRMSALNGEGMSLAQAAELQITHHLKPFGSDPQVTRLSIGGRTQAALIMPSADQEEAWNKQAALVLPYPAPLQIGNDVYHYFILLADQDHIEEIGQTIQFEDRGRP
jgi:beta-lactamase regulating signal transducer with metallopeptidase domain